MFKYLYHEQNNNKHSENWNLLYSIWAGIANKRVCAQDKKKKNTYLPLLFKTIWCKNNKPIVYLYTCHYYSNVQKWRLSKFWIFITIYGFFNVFFY